MVVSIEDQLVFKGHIYNMLKKASQKLNALTRINSYMEQKKKTIIMNAYINLQFGYCALVWMMHSRQKNKKINRIYEGVLGIVYQDDTSTFQELLTDKSVKIHTQNLQILAPEMFKVKRNIIGRDFSNCKSTLQFKK